MMIEKEIRGKVQTAYSIASHVYSLYKDEKNVDELREMVVEILRPIRWNNGRGYYFAGRVHDKTIDLFADDPAFEGTTSLSADPVRGKNLVDEFIRIVREKEAGVVRYNWSRRAQGGKTYPKISFVKYFKPFDWYIGAGMYIDDMEEIIQDEVLARIQRMKFGKEGSIFGFRYDGTIICARDEQLVGRSINDLKSNTGRSFGRELFKIGLQSNSGGYVNYTVRKGPEHKISHILAFVRPYKNWQWVVGASMNMDEMEKAIEQETEIYKRIAFKNIFLFASLFAFAVALLLVASYSYSLKIRHAISVFTDFFRKAADSKVKMDNEDLLFSEFKELAYLANKMVDDMVSQDLLLHRDELRLDTLLQLGRLEGHSLQDIYDFTLQRIVQITRSEEGYIASVDDTHFTICSFCRIEENGPKIFRKVSNTSCRLEDGGPVGHAVQKREEQLINDHHEDTFSYPFEMKFSRRIDMPISNGGKVVIVAGVCADSMSYDATDIRQMRMILEGMWLHILRINSEKELERLERQVIAVSEEERSQIGRDLHDDLGSHLSGVEMLSKVLQKKLEVDSPEMASQLNVIRNLIRSAIEKTRRLSQGLYPVHLIENGLEASIEELAVEIENLFPLRCVLSFDSDTDLVDNTMATHIYFIVREAVFNAARHGKPDVIDITFRCADNFLRVQIADDGCGVGEKLNQKKGMGFHTMKYRAKAIGASLDIETRPEGGTIVILSGDVLQ
jgi:signal transduction histidine kinase